MLQGAVKIIREAGGSRGTTMNTNTGDTDIEEILYADGTTHLVPYYDENLNLKGQVIQIKPEVVEKVKAAITKKLEWEKQEAVKNAFQVHHKQYPNCPPPLQATKEKLG